MKRGQQRGRCQLCLRAGELFGVTHVLTNGSGVVRRRLCEHCALHDDTPAMHCNQCFPQRYATN